MADSKLSQQTKKRGLIRGKPSFLYLVRKAGRLNLLINKSKKQEMLQPESVQFRRDGIGGSIRSGGRSLGFGSILERDGTTAVRRSLPL